MKPRRILIFSLAYYPRYVGGAEVAVKEITDRIGSSEIEFDMITLRTEKASVERIGNVNVYRAGLPWYGKANSPLLYVVKYVWIPAAFIKALSLHRARKYDVIWSIMANYAGGPALFFKWIHKNVKFILTLQEGDPFDHIKKRAHVTYPFLKKLFRMADHIQAISNYLADWAKSMGATCPVTVVPNAVPIESFIKTVPADQLETLKNKIGKKEGDVFLITTSRLVTKNAVGDIIDALTYLPVNVKLLVLGVGNLESTLKAQTEELKLQDKVLFEGFVSHERMLPYLKISDIFIRPSLSEGFGISFIEAMASGLPVITTPVGGIVDFLKDGETGLFCEVKNPRSIAQKVEKLMKDKESRDYIVRNALLMVKEKYDWGKVAGEMEKIFNV